jgi:glucose-6-phosphate 1-dehydrogenase
MGSMNADNRTGAAVFVIFGYIGDFTRRKLVTAL